MNNFEHTGKFTEAFLSGQKFDKNTDKAKYLTKNLAKKKLMRQSSYIFLNSIKCCLFQALKN